MRNCRGGAVRSAFGKESVLYGVRLADTRFFAPILA
jgi:hypothetical protein